MRAFVLLSLIEFANGRFCEYDVMIPAPAPAGGGAGRERRALVTHERLWAGGVVPYTFTQEVSQGLRAKTEQVMRKLEGMAAVSFRQAPRPARGFLVISTRHVENLSGCWATVGRPTDIAKMNLGWCREERHITHELLHVLGMWHEQSRSDSGTFINIDRNDGVNDCIISGTDSRGFAYDFRSIMHYPLAALKAEPTAAGIQRLRLQNARPDQVGFWGKASAGDIQQLADMYGRGNGIITRDQENTSATAGIVIAAIVVAVIGLYWGSGRLWSSR